MSATESSTYNERASTDVDVLGEQRGEVNTARDGITGDVDTELRAKERERGKEDRSSSARAAVLLDGLEESVWLPQQGVVREGLLSDRGTDDTDEACDCSEDGHNDELGEDLVAWLHGETRIVGHVEDLRMSHFGARIKVWDSLPHTKNRSGSKCRRRSSMQVANPWQAPRR